VAGTALGQTATPAQQLFTPFAPKAVAKSGSLALSLSHAASLPLSSGRWKKLFVVFPAARFLLPGLLSNFDLISGFLPEWLFFSLDFEHE